MCDIADATALWIWAVVFSVEKFAGTIGCIDGAGLLIALATLTKYYAVTSFPCLQLTVWSNAKVWGLAARLVDSGSGAWGLPSDDPHFCGRTLTGIL